jgi:hypothetical protein
MLKKWPTVDKAGGVLLLEARENKGMIRSVLWLCGWLLLSMLPVFAGVKNGDCLDCHGDNTLFKTNSAGQPISLFVEVARFKLSAHRTNDCISCHADITGKHPDDNRTVLAVDCGPLPRAADGKLCGQRAWPGVEGGTRGRGNLPGLP